jgi:hypothetical protein
MPGPYTHWESTKRLFKQLFIWAIVFVGGMALLVYWFTPEKERLAQQYNVSQDAVIIEPKPHGCDFTDAPLGEKHCHYQKVVDTDKACPAPDCRVTSVYVHWRKVEE